MHSKPRLSIRIFFYFMVAGLLFGITEIGARIFEYFGPRTFVFKQFDPVLGLSLIPDKAGIHRRCYDGYVSINSHGLRDAPRTLKKEAGVYRIGVFGDSLIEGLHVSPKQVSTRRLEAKLNHRASEKSWEVLNFSVGGYGTVQEYLRYLNDGKKFDLDLVVLFFTDNDLENNLPGGGYDGNLYGTPTMKIDEKQHTITYPEKPLLHDTFSTLMDASAALRFVYKFYYHFLAATKVKAVPHIQGFPVVFSLLDPQNEDGLHAWKTGEYALSLLAKEVRKDGAQMVLVYSGYNIYDPSDEIKTLAEDYMRETGHQVDFTHGTQRLTKWAKDENIPAFNFGLFIHEFYKKEGLSPGDLSYSCDSHFNPEGHNVIAEFLFDKVTSSKLLKRS
jgi:hypothetical protein